MKRKALAIVLTLVMLVGVLPMGAFAASYTDTEGHWAEKSIDRWTEAKVLEGMGDNKFAPDDNLTRAQAMTIFSRLLNLTEKGDISKLEDVAADAWYTPYIETGYAYEIIKGTSDTTFDPEGSITREQFFSIFARATGIPGADKLAEGKTFTDLDQISSWAIDEGSVYSMINRGYLNGYPDGSLQPKGNITRAEVAKVLDNAISDYITADGTYAISGDGIVVVLAKDVKLTGSNFNGHIVSSCPDSVLDLSGLTGTPYIYVLGDNTKIINAKPGTTVAVNPAADNVTVNGVKVAYNPYAPVSPYVVPNGGSTSGGGGGGGGGAATRYVVNATFSVPYVNNNTFTISSNIYSTPQKVSTVLRDMSANAIGDMGMINAVNSAYQKLADEGKQVRHTSDGYTVTSEAKGDIVVVTVEGADVDLEKAMNDMEEAYAATSVKSVLEVPENVGSAWLDLAEVFSPTNIFNVTGKNTIEFKSGEGYAQLLSDAFAAAAKVADSGMTQDQLDTILAAAGANWNSGVVTTKNFFNDCNFTKNVNAASELMKAEVGFYSDDNFIAAVQDVFGMVIDQPELKAIVEAGFHHDGWLHGPYSMEMGSVVVKK